MDFFFDEKEGDTQQKNEVNSSLPPSNSEKRKKWKMRLVAIGIAVASFAVGGVATWFSLDKEMRTLIKVKNGIEKNYYKEITDDEFYGAIFKVVNEDVLDRYSCYMTADEQLSNKQEMAGNRSGLGLVFATKTSTGEDQLRIVRICGNSPAEAAGVKVGSFVNGFGKSETEIKDSVRFDELLAFLSGFGENEAFYLRLNENGTEKIVSMSKQAYVESYVFYRTKTEAYGFSGKNATVLTKKGEPLACLNEDTAYIRLTQFAGVAKENFEDALKQFKRDGKKNLVLDLRGNGGGYLDVMQALSGYFCKNTDKKRPVVAVADYGKKIEKYRADFNRYDEYFSADSRICVLADINTASASECLIGSMVDYGAISYADICLSERGGVAKTFGKGIMQTTYYLSARLDALKLTTAEIKWPSGYSIHDRGVLPEDGAKTVAESDDDEEELVNAISLLFGE